TPVNVVTVNIIPNRRRQPIGGRRFTAGDGRTNIRRGNILRNDGHEKNLAGRLVRKLLGAGTNARRRPRGERTAGRTRALHDDEMREREQLLPAMPRGNTVERVAPENETERLVADIVAH